MTTLPLAAPTGLPPAAPRLNSRPGVQLAPGQRSPGLDSAPAMNGTAPTGVNTPLPVAQGPRLAAPTGKPADANPSQVPLSLSPANSQVTPPSAPATAAAAPIPLAAGSVDYASITPNTPGSATDYTNKTIAPGAGVDRLALAKSNFQNFKSATEPGYKADLRDANTAAAGAGQIGSGMLRGRLGDIADTHDQRLQLAESNFLNNATEGSIGDQYNNIGIAQQQQGFQSGQQQTAFQQQIEQQQLEEMLRSGAFGRSATTLGLGESGNPSDIALALSGIYGQQASGAGQAAGSLLGNSQLQQLLRQYGISPGGTAGGTPYDVNDPNQNIYAGTQ